MTRLTANELGLIPAAGPQAAQMVALDAALAAARRLQAETFAKAFAGLGRLIAKPFAGIARARNRGRMIEQLSRLDDRMLGDIGLERGTIVEAVDATLERRAPVWALEGAAERLAGFGKALVGPIVRWHRTQVTLGELAQLDDRLLADIGLCRGDLTHAPEAVVARAEAANRNQPEGPSIAA